MVLTKTECLCQEVSDVVGAAQVKSGLSTCPKRALSKVFLAKPLLLGPRTLAN